MSKKSNLFGIGDFFNQCGHDGIDVCPMEGFDAEGYDEILELTDKNR